MEATSKDIEPPAAVCHAGVVLEVADGVPSVVVWAFNGMSAKLSTTVEAIATSRTTLIRSVPFP
jgi:hypothetical protein